MSNDVDWEFAGSDDGNAKMHAAVRYLLRDPTGAARDPIVLEILEIAHQGCRLPTDAC